MLSKLLDGRKTYIGLAIAFLGALGAGSFISEGEANQVVNLIIELVGLVIAVIGRIKARPKPPVQ